MKTMQEMNAVLALDLSMRLGFILKIRSWVLHQMNRWAPRDSLRGRYMKAASWSFMGILLGRGLNLVSSIIVARFLGKSSFGELGIITSTIGMVGAFGGLGLGVTATRYVARYRHSNPVLAGRAAGFTIVVASVSYGLVALLLVIFAPGLAGSMLNASHLTGNLQLAALVLFLGGIDGVQIGILSGFEAFREIAKVVLIRCIISLPVTVLFVWSLGLTGAVVALVCNSFLCIWLNGIWVRRVAAHEGVPISYKFNRSLLAILFQFSIPAFLVSILSSPVYWGANAILVNQPNGYSEMGLVNAAIQWRSLAIMIPSILSSIGVAIQSSLYEKGDHSGFRKVFLFNLGIQVVGTTLIVVVLIAFAPWILSAYGNDFRNGIVVFDLMAVGWIPMTVNSVFWDTLLSKGSAWLGFIVNLIGAAVLLVVSWLFAKDGAQGLAIAYLLSYITLVICQLGFWWAKGRDIGNSASE